MAHHLMRQLQPMVDDLTQAAGQATVAVTTSRDPLLPSTQETLAEELNTILPEVSVQFETDAEQAPGLVLRIGGAQVDWTTESYVDEMDTLMAEQLAKNPDMRVQTHEH